MLLRIVFLVVAAMTAMVINLSTGDITIEPKTALAAVFSPESLPAANAFQLEIVRQIRLPRA